MSEKETRISKRKNKKKISKKKILLFIAIPLSVLLIGGAVYAASIYSQAEKAVSESFEQVERKNNKETSDLREEVVNPIEDNVSVLIIGVDDSEKRSFDENSRSDTLILATFNKEHNDVNLLSIPRDSYVFVPEVQYYTKINHAHFFGGPSATIETVEEFLHVPIDYYVRINFDAFIEVVDSIGGIYYNVPFEMYEQDSKDKKDAIHLLPGYQKLNGEEALALARTRKYDSDLERGQRQQEIIKAVMKEAASVKSLFKLDNLIEAVGDNMTTNLTFDEMKSFVSYGLTKNIAINSVSLEGSGGYMDDGLWYYQVDEESRQTIENKLRNHLDLPTSRNNTEFSAEQ
ncbi:LCP family protein [Paucisalibacillus globulus]|uniref:LCP family protein n=1 Tax=Paucisalibacillus globulus TaxID=351095 RepID=UPI000BB904EA|nr:LCP family protein [Paucisalibacillus globulus]